MPSTPNTRPQTNWRLILVVVMAVSGLTAIVLLFVYLFKAAYFQGQPAGAQVTFGGLALIGVLATAAVSFVGVLLKQSIDKRTLELTQSEHRRMQVDTAMQTVKLMALENGQPAPVTQVSAALLVLGKLGETSMAIDLAIEMWPKNQITASSAVRLVDQALASADVTVQRSAALLLLNNFQRLHIGDDQYEWPSLLDEWPENLDDEVRATIVLTLIRWLKLRKAEQNDDFRLTLLAKAGKDVSSALVNVTHPADLKQIE